MNYEANITLRGQDILNKEVQYLKFHRLIGDIQNPILPKKAFILEREFGSFKFYRLKQDWLQQFSSWERAGLQADSLKTQAYSWEKISNSKGIRPLIGIKDSFTLAMENKERQFYNDLGFTLNIVDVSDNNHKFSANLLEGSIKKMTLLMIQLVRLIHGSWIIPLETTFLKTPGIQQFLYLTAPEMFQYSM